MNILLKIQCKGSSKGFTLIELMVATALFIIVIIMSIGSLGVTSGTNKKAQQLSLAMENVNFAMESMTRSLRIGSNYVCKMGSDTIDLTSVQPTEDCNFINTDGGYLVAFKPSTSSSSFPFIAYKSYNNGTWTSLQRCDDNNTCTDLTSSNVNVEVLKFFVIGSGLSDGIQSSVYIMMKGTVTVEGESSSFAIQTIASQRSTEQ